MQEIKQSAPIREERLGSQAVLRFDVDDPTMLVVMRQEGFEGIGIYMAVVRHLALRGGRAPLSDVGSIARSGSVSAGKVLRIIATYGGFDVDQCGYFSRRERKSPEPAVPLPDEDDSCYEDGTTPMFEDQKPITFE